MGCASSKRIKATVDVYRPAPSSFAVFDINAIEEPWVKSTEPRESLDDKPPHVPQPLLDKLNSIDDAPRTWDEVSKALEDLKPNLKPVPAPEPEPTSKPGPTTPPAAEQPKVRRKSFSFHTLEELEAKTTKPKPESNRVGAPNPEIKKFGSVKLSPAEKPPEPDSRNGFHGDVPKSLKDNIFIMRDRMERQKEGKPADGFIRLNPLAEFEEICPPGGSDGVVVYMTSLGVRRTYEDCSTVKQLMEIHRVVFDERDVSLHPGFLNEVRELLGEGVSVPRVFVKGRYVGGVEEVVGLNETGRLSRILNWARVERGVGRLGCEGCGGARFVPCLDCGGSCKVVVDGKKERCGECNENGLVLCPLCI